jgi:hypothetical protein
MDNLTFSKIKEAIEKYQDIAIVTRQDPGVDEMAGALSLYLAIKGFGKNPIIATPNEPLVEVSSLVGIDEVKTSLGAGDGDLVVSFPYREGEIEKVSYTRDDNFLNIVVKAGENGLNFNESDVKFTRGGKAPELLFVVGSPRVSDLGNLFDPQSLKDTVVVNIDNKADNQGFGDILVVSNRFSSVSEAISNLILSTGLIMDLDIAQNLMLGLAVATNNFQSENTSPLAFEMAGVLLRQGALRPQSQSASRRKLPADDFGQDLPVPQPRPQQRVQPIQPSMEQHVQQQPRRQQQSLRPQQQQQQRHQQLTQQLQQLARQQEEKAKKIETLKQDDDIPVEDNTLSNPPDDWLEPKIYKGSTSF